MNEGQMRDLMKLVWGADPTDTNNPRNVGNLLENTLNNNTNAITTALQNNLTAINALTTANQNRTTSKVVDVPFFYGRDDEDPYEWCRLFEAAFAANGWPDNRKIALAAGFLKEAARDWYEEDRGNINQWHVDNNANNFDTRFINYFATAARRNQWTRELQNIKQGDNESVENYSRRFKKLLNKATQGEALAARYQINYYINGLKSFLVGQVVIGNTDTLEATITRAKLVELGVNTTLLTTTPVTISTTEPIPTTTTTTVKPTPQVDEMEALTKQMQQLALNYANLSSVLMVQQSTPRNTRPRPNNNNNQNRQNGQAPTQNSFNPNITCFRCGNVGHISRNCQMGRNTNNGNINGNNNNNNRPRQRAPVTPINYADDEAEIYYDEYEDEYEEEWEEEDEYEAYVTTRFRSVPYEISSPRGKRTRFSESRKEDQLRTQPILPVTPSTPMDMDATAEPSTKRKVRTKMVPAPIENVNEFDIAKYISDLPCGLSIGQATAQLPVYRKGLIQSMRRKREKIDNNNYIGESYYGDSNSEEETPTTAAKCEFHINQQPVIAVIDSGAAERLIKSPILTYPDFEQPFIIHTDASGTGLGAVLSQIREDGKEHVVAYASRSLNKAECNYPITDQECLAIVWAIKHFQHYLGLKPFTIVTDHSALKWLKTSKIPKGRRARWVMDLQQYDFNIKHRAGKANANADALSRMFEEDSQTHSCFMISIEKEGQTNVNESSTPVHEEYDADSEDDYTDRPAQRAIDLLNRCDNLIYDMQSYIEERSENNSPINIVSGIRYDFDNPNGPHPEDL
ncbi:hypothetical protein GLOIN_2v1777707 [Rhizophagus irregularis DAOM 181602=DAOM 197198]|nr:hypothetical protein GLOIN_2v1777707 [Rhizophagus irregularis DAOM 181602=DAOM 197198]